MTVGLVFTQSLQLSAESMPTNAAEYCRGQGTTGESRWQDCIDRVNQQLRSCNEIVLRGGSPEDAEACRERILSGEATREREEARLRREQAALEVDTGTFQGDCSEGLHPDQCGITGIIRFVADVLAIIVGVVIVMMIVIGGIQYSSAGSNPQAVSAAKKKISQALFALLIYFFLFAFLQWLVPGGVF